MVAGQITPKQFSRQTQVPDNQPMPLCDSLSRESHNYNQLKTSELHYDNIINSMKCSQCLSMSCFQNSSSWTYSVGGLRSFFSVNSSIVPNYLSVTVKMPTWPSGGRNDFTRLICTWAFSALGQCRMQIENWNITNPSVTNCLRKSEAA